MRFSWRNKTRISGNAPTEIHLLANPGTSGVEPACPKKTSQEEWIWIRNPVRGKHGSLANAHESGAERDWVESGLALNHLLFSIVSDNFDNDYV